LFGCAARADGLQVEQTGATPKLKIADTSPGVFKAVVTQSTGGGINEFYNLASDPEARINLAKSGSGLFEIGWHGAPYKNSDADKKTCCPNHATDGKPESACSDGTADWPSGGHTTLKATGELSVIEQSPARVRVRAKAPFTWWGKFVHTIAAEATYTFYPSGRIVVQMHVTNPADGRPFHWSYEYGPHLMVVGQDPKPDAKERLPVDLGFEWSTPKSGVVKPPAVSEELALAASEKTKTRLMLTITPEEHALFNCHMRHNGRSIGWDRMGYGSGRIVMGPGYDSTWACMIELSADTPAAAAFKTAVESVPFALDYRAPAKITGATLVTDDAGDFNKDGFNESEGCYVLRGPGPLAFTFEKGQAAGFAPAFKVLDWKGEAPKSIQVDGKDAPFAGGVVDGKLIVQLLGTVAGERATIGTAQ
jgi:hypothetical protein